MLPRFLVPALLASALLAATPAPPVGLTVEVQRTSFDLLDSLPIDVVAHNPSSTVRICKFPQPSEYAIEIAGGEKTMWTSLPPSPPPGVVFGTHTRAFTPGPTTIVVYEWNGLTRAGWSPLPGTYTIRARLLTDGTPPAASLRVRFTAPLPPAVLPSLRPGEIVTVGGTLDDVRLTLSDSRGSLRLTRRLLVAPAGVPIVIRGFATDHPDGIRTFSVVRWAPLGPLPAPAPTPTS